MPILETDGLRKWFGEVRAVDDVDLAIEDGPLVSVIGPNGAGKTTLINLLTGGLVPDAGRIRFNEEDVTDLPVHVRVRRGIGRSFQLMNIFPRLSVFENVKIPVLAHLGRSSQILADLQQPEVDGKVSEILKEVGLNEKKDLDGSALSHGDQRLLEISVALATEPKLLLLDEPTAGMNPIERVNVLQQIRRLTSEKKTTVVIVEHDMDIVFSLSDRIVVMHRGKILADGKPSEIRDDKNVAEVYLGEDLL